MVRSARVPRVLAERSVLGLVGHTASPAVVDWGSTLTSRLSMDLLLIEMLACRVGAASAVLAL